MVVTLEQAVYIHRTLELAGEYRAKVAIHLISDVSKRLVHIHQDVEGGVHLEHDTFMEKLEDAQAIFSNNEHYPGPSTFLWAYKLAAGLVEDRRLKPRVPLNSIPVIDKMPMPAIGRVGEMLSMAGLATGRVSITAKVMQGTGASPS